MRRHKAVREFVIERRTVQQMDEVVLVVEMAEADTPTIRLEADLRQALGVRISCRVVPAGTLPPSEPKAKRQSTPSPDPHMRKRPDLAPGLTRGGGRASGGGRRRADGRRHRNLEHFGGSIDCVWSFMPPLMVRRRPRCPSRQCLYGEEWRAYHDPAPGQLDAEEPVEVVHMHQNACLSEVPEAGRPRRLGPLLVPSRSSSCTNRHIRSRIGWGREPHGKPGQAHQWNACRCVVKGLRASIRS